MLAVAERSLLRGVEQRAAAASSGSTASSGSGMPGWKDKYNLATSSDLAIGAYRRWLHGAAGGGPAWLAGGADLPPFDPRREVLLDRWGQHCRDCPDCRKALRACRVLTWAAWAAAAAAATLAATWAVPVLLPVLLHSSGRGGTPGLVAAAAAAVVAAACAAAAWWLGAKQRGFVFVDYVHQDM